MTASSPNAPPVEQLRRLGLGDERFSFQCAFGNDRRQVLACGRQIAPHTAEDTRPVLGSEAARGLLLQFDHPQVTFRTIIGTMKGRDT